MWAALLFGIIKVPYQGPLVNSSLQISAFGRFFVIIYSPWIVWWATNRLSSEWRYWIRKEEGNVRGGLTLKYPLLRPSISLLGKAKIIYTQKPTARWCFCIPFVYLPGESMNSTVHSTPRPYEVRDLPKPPVKAKPPKPRGMGGTLSILDVPHDPATDAGWRGDL